MKCTRPDWSHEFNDYCPCDNQDQYNDAFHAGEDPCSECTWYKEHKEW